MASDMFTLKAPLTLQELKNAQHLDLYYPNLTRARRWTLDNCIFLAFDQDALPNAQHTGHQALSTRQGNTSDYPDKNERNDGPSVEDQLVSLPVVDKHKCGQPQTCKTCVPDDCSVCSKLVEFPSPHSEKEAKVRRLREVNPREFISEDDGGLGVCAHFLAISYSRTDLADLRGDEPDGPPSYTYDIRQLDGTMRRNRVPDHILDQAICASFVHGCRLFWVDVESFPPSDDSGGQGDFESSATGNSSIMFEVTHYTAGLLSVDVDSQEELQALSWLAEESHLLQEQDEARQSEILYHLVRLLDRIMLDRWYTCAFTIQEMINAGDNLVLVIHREVGMDKHDWPPPGSVASSQRHQHPEVVCLPLKDLQRAVGRLLSYLRGNSPLSSIRHYESWGSGDPRPEFAVVSSLAALHPRVRSPNLKVHIRLADGVSLTPGPRADAAAALTLLKKRVIKNNAQFLGLLSDLCRYETRFRPESVAGFGGSIRAAVLRLSLLNGDFSLLAPEAYGSHQSENIEGTADGKLGITSTAGIPQWLRPFDTDTSVVNLPDFYSTNFVRQTGESLYDPTRFHFPAYLWKVDSSIDMSYIQREHREAWLQMRPLCFTLRLLKNETPEAMMRRGHQLITLFEDNELRKAVQDDLLRTGTVGEHNLIWSMIPRSGCEISLKTLTQSIAENSDNRIALSALLVDILRFLFQEADSGRQPLAQGVANSIWQSMRLDALPPGENQLPDEVGPALFDHPDMQASAHLILRLDAARGWKGEFHQSWLLDRIMRDGRLWIGRYKREIPPWPPGVGRSENRGQRQHTIPAMDSPHASPELTEAEAASQPTALHSSQESGQSFQGNSAGQPESTQSPGDDEKRQSGDDMATPGRVNAQLRNMALTGLLESKEWDESKGATLSEEDDEHIPIGRILSLMLAFGSDEDAVWLDKTRTTTLVSVFDVDGPCLVATPYSSDWEVLPHPEYRSMSVCWVVEPSSEGEVLNNLIWKPRKTAGATDKGKEPESTMASPDEEDFPPDDESEWPSPPSTPQPDLFLRGRYRVVDKVKGMWDIMDKPWQQYQFL